MDRAERKRGPDFGAPGGHEVALWFVYAKELASTENV
jgi:hypothetical protein